MRCVDMLVSHKGLNEKVWLIKQHPGLTLIVNFNNCNSYMGLQGAIKKGRHKKTVLPTNNAFGHLGDNFTPRFGCLTKNLKKIFDKHPPCYDFIAL